MLIIATISYLNDISEVNITSQEDIKSIGNYSDRQQAPVQLSPSDTLVVEKKELYSIRDIGGGQRFFLKLTDVSGREIRFEGPWVSAASAAVFRGDKIYIQSGALGDTFVVLDRTKPPMPLGKPLFLKYIEENIQYHPSTLEGRRVTVTFVADYPIDVSIPHVSEEIRVQVAGTDEPGFTRFLENVKAGGTWVTLEPVMVPGVTVASGLAATVKPGWSTPLNYPRVISDDMGRHVIVTVWPAGISVTSLRKHQINKFP